MRRLMRGYPLGRRSLAHLGLQASDQLRPYQQATLLQPAGVLLSLMDMGRLDPRGVEGR